MKKSNRTKSAARPERPESAAGSAARRSGVATEKKPARVQSGLPHVDAVPEDRETLHRLITKEWPAAAMSGDADKYVGFLTDDMIFMPPNQEAIADKKALREWLNRAFASAAFDITIHEPVEIVISGGWAFAHYRVGVAGRTRTGENFSFDRKYIDIWRQVNSAWKCHRHIWNENISAPPQSDRDAIAASLEKYVAALRSNQAEAVAAWWANDLVYMPTGIPTLRGRAALQAFLKDAYSRIQVEYKSVHAGEITVTGDVGVVLGTFEEILRPRDDRGSQELSGRFIMIWQRQPDGTWQIIRAVGTDWPSPHLRGG